MTNPRFEKAHRNNRFTALVFTVFFHAALFAGAYYFAGENTSIKDLVPETVKEWFNGEEKDLPKADKERA